MKKSPDERMKEICKARAGKIRKNISIAVAEIERIRANRKLNFLNVLFHGFWMRLTN